MIKGISGYQKGKKKTINICVNIIDLSSSLEFSDLRLTFKAEIITLSVFLDVCYRNSWDSCKWGSVKVMKWSKVSTLG